MSSILWFFTFTAPVTLDLNCFTGGSSGGASVTVDRYGGVTTRLKKQHPKGLFIALTNIVARQLAHEAFQRCSTDIKEGLSKLSFPKALPMLPSFKICNR